MIIVWWRRRFRAAQARLAAGLDAETLVRPPEKGNYRGATAPEYPLVVNSGVIALITRRLVFATLTGKTIEIPLTEITAVRESKVFKAAAVAGRSHLIICTAAGEIAFFVPDNAAWTAAIANACGRVGVRYFATQPDSD